MLRYVQSNKRSKGCTRRFTIFCALLRAVKALRATYFFRPSLIVSQATLPAVSTAKHVVGRKSRKAIKASTCYGSSKPSQQLLGRNPYQQVALRTSSPLRLLRPCFARSVLRTSSALLTQVCTIHLLLYLRSRSNCFARTTSCVLCCATCKASRVTRKKVAQILRTQ